MIDPRKHDRVEGMGCGTRLLIGAFVVGAVAMLGLVALAFLVPQMIDRAVEAYTDDAPVALDAPVMAPEEREALEQRVEDFQEAIDSGEFTRPLVLTEAEINAVLGEEVDREDGEVQVTLEPGLVRAYISMPIRAELPLGPWSRDLTGRYLNGVATIDLSIADGELKYDLREFEVKGRMLPDYALDALEREVERSGAFENDDVREYVDRAGELRIERGQIVLTPKGA